MALGGVASTAIAAPTTGILNGQYSIDQVFPVQRVPAYPPCADEDTYGPWTVTVNDSDLSASYPFSAASNGPVDIGADYLAIVESGNVSAPWAIARFTPAGNEVRYNGSAWVTEPTGGWTAEERFTAAGELYGVGDEGFMHASVPADYGNFFSNLGVLLAGQAVTYASDPLYNNCISSRAIADFASLASYPVPGAPISRTELTSLTTTSGTLGPIFEPLVEDYALPLPAGTTTASFTVVPAEAGAVITMTVGGVTTPLIGTETGPIALSGQTTIVAFEVTASNGATRTYTVTITLPTAGGEAPGGDELADTGLDTTTVLSLALIGLVVIGGGSALRLRVHRG